jgi:iron complex outermembrane receptor protein
MIDKSVRKISPRASLLNIETKRMLKKNILFKLLYQSISGIGWLILTIPGQAAESSHLASEEYYFQEMPVVLTASRLSQPLSESPSAMTIIDSEMIKASGFRTVPDLMNLVPGMYVGYADANNPIVSLHGSMDGFSRRMQVLIDGRSIYLPPSGTVNWADLPLMVEDVERIEVVRGPSSASYGPNSFYGVINIITRESGSADGGSAAITAGYVADASARLNKSAEKFDYRISAGYRSDAGIDNRILNDHSSTRVANFRANYHPYDSDSLDVQIGGSSGIYGTGLVGFTQYPFHDTTATSQFEQINWSHEWTASDETKLTYYTIDNNATDPYVCTANPCVGSQGFVHQDVYSQRNEIELQNTNQLGDNNRLVWGGGTRRDYADYPLYLGQPFTLHPWQAFAHDEWHITQAAVMNIGSMLDDDGMGNRSNSPRAAFNYHITHQHTLRFGISTATRSPSMGEANVNAQNTVLGGVYIPPITPLIPEKVLSKEIGYLGEFRSIGVTVDSRVYIDQVRDIISWDKFAGFPASTADSFKNLVSADYTGFETTVKYSWDEGHSFLSSNYAYQSVDSSLGSYPTLYFNTTANSYLTQLNYPTIPQLYSQYVPNLYNQSAPRHSGSFLLSQRLPENWQFSAGLYLRENVRVLNVAPDVTPEYAMTRLDLRIAKTLKYDSGHNAELAFVVQNATQNDYTKYGTTSEVANVLFSRRSWLTGTFNF